MSAASTVDVVDSARGGYLSSEDSPVIRRPAVTYGRRAREPLSDADTSTSGAFIGSSSRDNSFRYLSSGPEDEVPPSSDDGDASFHSMAQDEDSEHEGPSASSEFQFSWRKGLKELDTVYAERDGRVNEQGSSRNDANSSSANESSRHGESQSPVHSPTRHATATVEGNLAQAKHGLLRGSEDIASPSSSPDVVVRRRAKGATFSSDHDDLFSPKRNGNLSPTSPPISPTPSALHMPPPPYRGKGKSRAADYSDSDNESDLASSATRKFRRAQSSAKGREKRIRPPSKKEMEETKKATARMIAERAVSLPRAENKRLPITSLFAKLERKVTPGAEVELPPIESENTGSDPIQPFSSPAVDKIASMSSKAAAMMVRSPTWQAATIKSARSLKPEASIASLPQAEDSSDDEIPETGSVLQQDERSRLEDERRKRLEELKLRALEQQKHRAEAETASQDESDLEIVSKNMQSVAKEEARARKAMEAQGLKRSVGRHRQLALAGAARRSDASFAPKGFDELPPGRELHVLQAAAAVTFSRASTEMKNHSAPHLSKDHLNQLLLRDAERQAEEVTRQKEEEWVRRGGKIKARVAHDAENVDARGALLAVVAKGLHDRQNEEDEGHEEGDDDDPDYEASQDESGQSSREGSSDEQTSDQEHVVVFQDQAEPDENTDTDDNAAAPARRNVRRPIRRPFTTIHSDEEIELGDGSPPMRGRMLAPDSSFTFSTLPVLNHRASVSSFENHTEDGTDKENDARLMYDRGEDKENTAIATQSLSARGPLGQTSGVLGHDLGRSPFSDSDDLDFALAAESTPMEDRRAPLQDISKEHEEDADDPFAFGSPQRAARQLIFSRAGGHSTDLAESSPLLKEFGGAAAPQSGFADLFEASAVRAQESPMVPKAKALAGGISQFFTQESPVQQQDSPGFSRLRTKPSQDLTLTMDSGLQPALEVSSGLRRRAEDIFAREQGLLAEGSENMSDKDKSLHINEFGFFTQSVPAFKVPKASQLRSPAVAGTSPMSISSTRRPAIRTPLAILEADTDMELQEEQPKGRLMKRKLSPAESPSQSRQSSPSPSPSKSRNAFDILRKATRPTQKLPSIPGRRLGKSEFIEGEAEESDDDAMMGFGGRKKDDDEEDDDPSQDQTLAELVDDAAMDEKTLAEEVVLEKVREHQQEDDEAAEKIANDVAHGKYRIKRRDHGIGFEDSESDSDDEAAAARRRMQAKKRKIEGDSLEQLAKHPETLAFYQAYHVGNTADGDDFVDSNQDELTLVDGRDSRDAEEEQEEDEPMTVSELHQKLREAAQEAARDGTVHRPFDPTDVSWVDHADGSNDESEIPAVKEVQTRSSKFTTQQRVEWDVSLQTSTRTDDERDRARLQAWAKGESRTGGAARSTGISAVTGHGKRRPGSSAANGRQRTTAGSSTNVKQATKVKKMNSVLSTISRSGPRG
ncbi:hypothetical protein WOLCODRAFT_143468 [Wolfiporia cocos MD-104 SS10]|uniref:DNA replication checkpoint mediator MRC1 domain-containing protein n=1 Tax=Wolfiporia cocos (strain MD-104) TaxID=742152 RepID=A0A2H3JR19_WOLCO|nr:hypothetical protein WOLCODRAFT_143468 [Wolfiporia cocos MD-104 SS10]